MQDFLSGKKTYTGIAAALIVTWAGQLGVDLSSEAAAGIVSLFLVFAAYGRKVARL